MDSKSLMIGDWVYNSHHKKNIKWDYSEMFCPNGIPVIGRDLEPIPLTPEILEKNGFEKWSAQYRYRVLKPNTTIDKSIHFTLMIDGEHICEVRNYNATRAEPRYYNVVRYVHELQHALRLCGLDDLADNFKV